MLDGSEKPIVHGRFYRTLRLPRTTVGPGSGMFSWASWKLRPQGPRFGEARLWGKKWRLGLRGAGSTLGSWNVWRSVPA